MPKLKTQKSVVKRFKISKTGKLQKKKAGQDHFNSREPSKVTRNKRRRSTISDSHGKNVIKFLPYA